ncbi:AAA family ATPase [Actinomycetospora sp. CA-101289]|uniref:AAA family ATPase n=1 Tax=Actinomycetospora sp. CA-101289 TaxID=3239893 RepID=UPI003D97EE94
MAAHLDGPGHPVLLGRGPEQDRIARLLGGDGGGALVVCGPPGIGKSALLAWAERAAHGRRVLRATGTVAELGLPYAGLHQILRPLLAGVTALPAHRRRALDTAFGGGSTTPGTHPDLYAVALSALELLAVAAAADPLLVLADDVHWMDPASQQALAFLARRTASDRVVVLAAQRDTEPGPMLDRSLTVTDLAPLDEAAALAVLAQTAGPLDPDHRARILDLARGNPLALHELPRTVTAATGHDADRLPLTRRLERSFTARVGDLGAATTTALEVAALDDGAELAEILAATALLAGPVTAAVLEPAVVAGLVVVEGAVVRFRHPLVRSAVRQRLAPEVRRAGHAALARVVHDQPERAVRHRAAAALHPDAALADDLERSADRALGRGAVATAVADLDRAAQLSEDGRARRDRLFRAGVLAHDLGSPGYGDRLRAQFRDLVEDEADQLRHAWLGELAATDRGGEHRVALLLELAERAHATGDDALALRFLRAAALRCWNFCPDRPVGAAVVAAADDLGVADPAARAALLAHGEPLEHAHEVLALIARAREGAYDAATAYRLGHAAACVGAFDVSGELFAEAADGLRSQGRLHTLGTTLVLLSWSALRRGRLDVAVSAADEGARLCAETDQPFWHACAQAAHGLVAALRGDLDAADALVRDAERIAAPHRFAAASAVVLVARATTAAARGDHALAFALLARLHDPLDPGFHPVHGLWSLAGLADAAAARGEEDAAGKILAELPPGVRATSSPAGRMNLAHAEAVLGPDGEAEERLRALASTDTGSWPHERHRLLLALGARLLRADRALEARAPLREARDGFDALGSAPWAQRARDALHAAGEPSPSPVRDAWDDLSPQEAQIAAMVAEGLSNREIGERLFLSHRTVGSHLYRMFPKLGIHSRVELLRLAAAGGRRRS